MTKSSSLAAALIALALAPLALAQNTPIDGGHNAGQNGGHADRYQLTKDDLVRWTNPRIKVELHPEWILNTPPLIDKATFRKLQPGEHAPDEIYVRFKPGTTDAAKDAAHARLAAAVIWQSELVPDLYQVRIKAGAVADPIAKSVNAYLDLGDVLYAEPSYFDSVDILTPNDTQWNNLWGMNNGNGIWGPWAWAEFTGNPNLVVAVIDTGVDLPHPDLVANQWGNLAELNGLAGVDDDNNGKVDDFRGWNVADESNLVTPCGSDHGTHVAGTIGAHGNNNLGVAGVNFRCAIMAVRCNRESDCSGLYSTANGLDYAAANGARVSNNSYGSYTFRQATYDIILAAQAAGHLFVASAGNDSTDNDAAPHYPDGYDLDNIISVTAVDSAGAQFYNIGLTRVDLGAPGRSITSTTVSGGYNTKNGTSMATPHVTGAAALVWGKHTDLTWWQIKSRILGATTPTASLAGKCVTGGRLYLPRALGVWAATDGGNTSTGIGTIDFPYAESRWLDAFNATPTHGSLNLLPGTLLRSQMNGANVFNKPMVIKAIGGNAVLGN